MSTPYYSAVEWSEYAGTDKNGNLNSMWRNKGATMIRKVALSQALREAFPDDLGGLYEPEEINTIQEELPETPIEVPTDHTDTVSEDAVEVIEPDENEVASSLFG